jgi:hypothetical protein
MNITEFRREQDKAKYLKIEEGLEINMGNIANIYEGVNKTFGKPQFTIYFKDKTAVSVSEALFIELTKKEKEQKNRTYKLHKIQNGLKSNWEAVPL